MLLLQVLNVMTSLFQPVEGDRRVLFVIDNISACPLDVILVIDGSGSIGARNFANFKQIAMGIVESLPVDEYEVHIGVIKYTTTAITVLSLTDSYDQYEIADHIWSSKYTPGATCTANALAAIIDMISDSGTADNSRAIVIFTDGLESSYKSEALAISRELQYNAHMYAVREYATSLFLNPLLVFETFVMLLHKTDVCPAYGLTFCYNLY